MKLNLLATKYGKPYGASKGGLSVGFWVLKAGDGKCTLALGNLILNLTCTDPELNAAVTALVVAKDAERKALEAKKAQQGHVSTALSIRGITVGTQLSAATELFRETGFLRVPSLLGSSFCVGNVRNGTISCSWVHPTSPVSQSALLKGAQVQWDEGIDADFSISNRGLTSLVYVFPCGHYENVLLKFKRDFGNPYSTSDPDHWGQVTSLWYARPAQNGSTYVRLFSADTDSKCKAEMAWESWGTIKAHGPQDQKPGTPAQTEGEEVK